MTGKSTFGVSPEQFGLAIMVAFGAPNNYSGLLPSKMTIARFAADEEDRKALRQGMLVASVLTLAEASGASLVAKSWLPLLMTTAVSGVLVWQYMDAINNPHSQVMPINAAQNANAPTGA
jgi:hypothetical protein